LHQRLGREAATTVSGQSCEFVGTWPRVNYVIRFLPERLGSGAYQSCRLISSIAQTQPASKFWRVAPIFSRAHAKSSSLVAGLGAPGIIRDFNQSLQRSARARASADRAHPYSAPQFGLRLKGIAGKATLRTTQ